MPVVGEKYTKILVRVFWMPVRCSIIIRSGIGWDLIRVFIKNLENTGFKVDWKDVKIIILSRDLLWLELEFQFLSSLASDLVNDELD